MESIGGWRDLVESPGGWIRLEGCGGAVTALDFPVQDRSSAEWMAAAEAHDRRRGGPAELLESVSAFMDDYFTGRRPSIDLPINLESYTGFTRRVLNETARIPWGEVCTYGDIAVRIGNPRAARAVGQALGRNPVPIIVPCHRVIASDGSIGGFGGGLCMKRRLLKIEGVEAP